jgi:hypothetical protein
MRRIAVVIAATSVLALAACATLPAGLDGNLTNNWSPMPTPTAAPLVAGDCYNGLSSDTQQDIPVSCTSSHEVQLIAVGTFTGTDAAATTAPASGSTAIRDAYRDCDTAAAAYLGADFNDGLLQLSVVVPDQPAWSGKARWYACDLAEIDTLSDYVDIPSERSFKGALRHAGPLKLSCETWTNHKTYIEDDFTSASCAKPHTGEFAGVFDASSALDPESKTFPNVAEDACEGVVDKFLGPGGADNLTVGWTWADVDEDNWSDGDHYIRCFAVAYTHDDRFIGSVKGIGRRTAKG